MTLGHWILGIEKPLSWKYIRDASEQAGGDLWFNFKAMFTPEVARWDGLIQFWHELYWPYFIGALGPGIVLSVIAYYVTIPLVEAYQKARAAKAKERGENRRSLKEAVAKAANRLKHRGEAGDSNGDDRSGSL
jgi:hypothetical protein